MYILTNDSKQILCNPGSTTPLMFESQEEADEFIVRNPGLTAGARVMEFNDNGVSSTERYGGNDDIW